MIALSFLWPRFRNDVLCVAIFFAMRIVLHVAFLAAAVRPSERSVAVRGSWQPAVLLILALALHVSWFQSSVRGILRRRAALKKPISEVKAVSIQHFHSLSAASRLRTMLMVRKLALKCREVRKHVTLHRTARRTLVTMFPIMLANVSMQFNHLTSFTSELT